MPENLIQLTREYSVEIRQSQENYNIGLTESLIDLSDHLIQIEKQGFTYNAVSYNPQTKKIILSDKKQIAGIDSLVHQKTCKRGEIDYSADPAYAFGKTILAYIASELGVELSEKRSKSTKPPEILNPDLLNVYNANIEKEYLFDQRFIDLIGNLTDTRKERKIDYMHIIETLEEIMENHKNSKIYGQNLKNPYDNQETVRITIKSGGEITPMPFVGPSDKSDGWISQLFDDLEENIHIESTTPKKPNHLKIVSYDEESGEFEIRDIGLYTAAEAL